MGQLRANRAPCGLLSTKSLLQVGGLTLVVGLFFGSRYFNRYRASRDVRAAMISELSKQLEAEVATGLRRVCAP